MTETDISREVRESLNKIPRVWVYRSSTGVARTGGRFLKFGVVGQGDLTGLADGRYLAVECKTPDPRSIQSAAQIAFQLMVEGMGGLYIVARSASQAVDAVLRAMEGNP